MAKLLFVVIDGLRADALECAHVRFLDGLIRNGILCRQLQGVQPCLTMPALYSMFSSLPPEEHGVVANSGIAAVSCNVASLFSLLWHGHRSSSMFFSHDQLREIAPSGSLHTSMMISSDGIRNVDHPLAAAAASHLQRETTDFCFLYLQGTDIAGTHFGYMSEPYLQSVEQADHALELLFENLAIVGKQDDYVKMIVSSHGGSWGQHFMQQGSMLPLIISGPGIVAGVELDREISALDLTPTMAKILDIPCHPVWKGRVVEELFVPQPAESTTIHLQQQIWRIEPDQVRSAA